MNSCIIKVRNHIFWGEKVDFMKKISELRAQNENMSQRELAEAISVTQASISRWETNQLSISGANLIKLATYFKVTADELLGIEEETTND